MKNYKMVLEYDGARYKGWQRLGNGEITIQAVLEKTIESVLQYSCEIHGSGRTDAGVHAKGQVASFKVPFQLKDSFLEEMNERLPEDIRIKMVEQVQGDFHARYSAVSKTYSYLVDTREKPDVFGRKYAYHFPWKLNVCKMREAAVLLEGTHDFSSFTDDKNAEKDKIRTITRIRIREKNGQVLFQYEGDGFMQHMVRIITGTLLEIGRGDREPNNIIEILESKERAKAGFLVPAKGLFLEKVDYL